MFSGDGAVIAQPLEPIAAVDFDEVPLYGKDRIAAFLDEALEQGVPEAVVNEGRKLAARVYFPDPYSKGARLDWGSDPDATLRKLQLASGEKYLERKQTFRDWFTENFTSVEPLEGAQKFTVNVPIFVLGSPQVDKAKVSMLYKTETETAGGFEMKVLGSGLGADKTFKVTMAQEQVCENGQGRRGNLEVPMIAIPIGFSLTSGPEVHFWNYFKDDSRFGRLIIRDCETKELSALAVRQDGNELDMSDTSGVDKSKKTIRQGTDYMFNVGVQTVVKGTELTLAVKGSLKSSQEITIAWELPGRYIYRPYTPAEGVGLIWMKLS
jgi:hypothetical protein